MDQAKLLLDRGFEIDRIDDRLYSYFVEHMGRCVYNGMYEPGHSLADKNGFREDVKDLIRTLNIPAMRYPGGNMISGFNWEDSVGPVEQRPRRLELSRTSIEPNTVGLHEFYNYAKELGSSLIYTVNLGTRGPAEARDLIEYCNHPSGSYFSDMRRKNGQEEPFNIKTWCLGNEMDGPWQMCHRTATDYGRVARETAKMMRWVDKKVELIAVGSSGTELPTYGQWEWEMLNECYNQVDYVAFHKYFRNTETDSATFLALDQELDGMIRMLIGICDGVKGRLHAKKTMKLSFDEWNVLHRVDVENHPERLSMPRPEDAWQVGVPLIEHTYTMEDAVLLGLLMITMLQHVDRLKIACLAQLVNVIAPIMTKIGGPAWVQTIYWPLYQASKYGRGVSLQPRISAPLGSGGNFGDVPMVKAAAVVNDDETLTIFAVNRSPEKTIDLTMELRGFEDYQEISCETLTSEKPSDANTFECPDKVTPKPGKPGCFEDGCFHQELPPMSWNVIRLRKA